MQVYLSTVVIGEPDNVTVCEGRSATFTCVLDSSITSGDLQWYRLLKDSNSSEMVAQGNNIYFTNFTINNILNTTLNITNAIKSYTGYYWVGTTSLNVCNVSLTVATSMYVYVCMQFMV